MHARSRKSYVYFRSIFVARAWFEIPPELGQSSNQTGLAHRTSKTSPQTLLLPHMMHVPIYICSAPLCYTPPNEWV